jgi:hypothetical protein
MPGFGSSALSCSSSRVPAVRRNPLAAAAGAAYSPSIEQPTAHWRIQMNTTAAIARRTELQPLLAASSRIAAAFAVCVMFTLVWTGAERASHEAVLTSADTFSRGAVQHATLPSVVIVGRREAVSPKNLRGDKAA